MAPELPKAHEWQPDHLRLAVSAAGVALWAWNVDTDLLTMDAHGFDLWGMPWSDRVTFEELSSHIHPADRDRVRSAFAATRAVLGAYETDFRILIGEDVRWIAARGKGDDGGIVGRTMFGIFLDVTGRKQAEEGHELLAGEMSHRVKNLLAIASGLTAITSRSVTNTVDMARELTGRLMALGRAHDLVRLLPNGQGAATSWAISYRSCWRRMTTLVPSADEYASPLSVWALAKRPRPLSRSLFTSLRRTR